METNLCARSPPSVRENTGVYDERFGSSVPLNSHTPDPLPDPAVAGEEEAVTRVDGGGVMSPLIDGRDGHLVLSSLPPWTHSFFRGRSYRSLPVVGVIVSDNRGKQSAAGASEGAAAKLIPSTDASSAAPLPNAQSTDVTEINGSSAVWKTGVSTSVERTGATIPGLSATPSENHANSVDPDATSNQKISHPGAQEGVGAKCVCPSIDTDAGSVSSPRGLREIGHHSVAPCKTPAAASRAAIASTRVTPADSRSEDDSDGYWHLLHDTLVMHGGVADLQYFVSTDGCRRGWTLPNVPACAVGSAVLAVADTVSQTGGTAANISKTEGKYGAESDRNSSIVRESEAREQTSVRQGQETISQQDNAEDFSDHLLTICRVSRRVCGHKGVAHGGFIATLVDNAMGYLAHLILPRAATKSLTVNYLKPLLAETVILVEVREVQCSGTNSRAEDKKSNQLSKCTPDAATTQRDVGTVDDCTGKDTKNREPGSRSTAASCTLEARVYTCIAERLRTMFPSKRDRPLVQGLQRVQEMSTGREAGSVSPQKPRVECSGTSDITGMDKSRDDGGNNCYPLREVNGDTAGNYTDTSEQRKGMSKPQSRNITDSRREEGNEARSTDPRVAECLHPGVWLVAIAQAVFVDVSAKWKDFS